METLLQKAQRLGIQPKGIPVQKEKLSLKNIIPTIGEKVGEFGTGMVKGVASSIYGGARLLEKAISPISRAIAKPVVEATGREFKPTEPIFETKKPDILQAKTPFETAGKITEQIGEFFIPTGIAQKGLALLPKAGKTAQFVAQTVSEATEYALKTAIQTGGDIPQTTGTFLLGLAIPPVIKGTGAVLKKLGTMLPERIYSVIFKTAEDDLRAAYQTAALGKEFNPTLAREVLDRGLKGNSQNMATYAFNKLDDLENIVQKIVKTAKEPLIVGNKKTYERFLQSVVNQFKGGFYSSRTREANSLIKELGQTDSRRIAMETALKLRRFIDNMRNTSSFRLDPVLSARQEEFKYAASLLRKKLSEAGLGELMNEERVFIEALDAIVSDAVKRNNKNVIGLVDLLAGGGGMVAGGGLGGLTAAVGIRAFQQPFTLTNLAQGIDKLTKKTAGLSSPLTKGIIGTAQ